MLLLVAMWLLGVVVFAAIVQVERRVDDSRRAQVVIAEMRIEQNDVVSIAFDPATSSSTTAPRQTAVALDRAAKELDRSLGTLGTLGGSKAPTRIRALSVRYLRLARELATLVATGKSRPAALLFGRSERPGGAAAGLTAGLDRANASYGASANHSRFVATMATLFAIGFLLIAFSVAFAHSVRARSRSQLDATTDALTRLGNRRKLFSDMQQRVATLHGAQTVSVGIFDLDGFKAYNDTFGHPAGDALLRRLGMRLTAVLGDRADTYRIGGDEFVVVGRNGNAEELMADAQRALSESGEGFSVGCSLGTSELHAGITLEQALHVADQRLYASKRSGRTPLGTEVKDALLQVLAEQNDDLVAHVGHVAQLAAAIATGLGLGPDDVELTRLTAELHDVGKAAVPAAILDKRGALDSNEWMFMRRHTTIGERIVAAAPALARLAPLVRATHERWDGAGYPDGLRGEEIPLSSRIVSVVDAYDAMTGDRPYRTRLSSDEAIEELDRCAGTQFDPTITDLFIHSCRDAADRFLLVTKAERLAAAAA